MSNNLFAKKTNLKHFVLPILAPLFVLGSILSNVFLSQNLRESRLDNFSYELVDFYKINYQSNKHPAIFNVLANDREIRTEKYDILYRSMYDSYISNGVRKVIDNDTEIDIEGFNGQLKLFTQHTFSIATTELETGGYYVDGGNYAAYYSDELFGPRKYMEPRFGADSFIYVSDSFADCLVHFYGLEEFDDPYKELLLNEKYCQLPIVINHDVRFVFSINNILYSNLRKGPFAKNVYENFAVIWSTFAKIKPLLDISFEVDLKTNPYTNKYCFKLVESVGLNPKNTTFRFSTYDVKTNQYLSFSSDKNTEIANKYSLIMSENNDTLYIIFILLIELVYLVFLWFVRKFEEERFRRKSLVSLLLIFLLYNCYCFFFYTNPIWSIFPIISTTVALLIYRKEVSDVFCKLLPKNKNKVCRKDSLFFEIEI